MKAIALPNCEQPCVLVRRRDHIAPIALCNAHSDAVLVVGLNGLGGGVRSA